MAAPAYSPAKDRTDAALVAAELRKFCEGNEAGTLLPTYSELRDNFSASDRAVRWALEELERQGKISRRRGARMSVSSDASATNGYHLAEPSSQPCAAVDSRTIVAINQPDQAVFDHAVGLLYNQVESSELSLVCRLSSPATLVVPLEERPLGYIVFGQKFLPLARELQSRGQRVVLVGMPLDHEPAGVPNVRGNHEKGGYLATRHLLEQGHRRIAFLGQPHRESPRLHGHERAVDEFRKRGIEIQDELLTDLDFETWTRNHEAARSFFSSPHAPTGIACWSDALAIRLLGFLAYIGVRVPDQVSVVGYDGLPEGAHTHPALTTIDSSVEDLVQCAVEVLTESVQAAPNHTVVIVPRLLRRESSAPPPRIC